ncbi:MAG TPA: hypothetical protein VEY92_02845 [Pseudoxanthomonas sp.]|nr:hypothetical protein [Pseudoxanthomonas sp.]
MQNDDPSKRLQEISSYLQKVTGQILTYQQFQKEQHEFQSQKHDQQIRALTQSAQAVTGSSDRLISEAVSGIKLQARDAIAHGVGEELAKVQDRANAAAAGLQSAIQEFAQQKALLTRERKKYALTWMGGIVIVATLAMLGVGSFVGAKLRELNDLTAKADYLSAYNAADVTTADGQLWVNVDQKNKQTINGKTYYLAKPR